MSAFSFAYYAKRVLRERSVSPVPPSAYVAMIFISRVKESGVS